MSQELWAAWGRGTGGQEEKEIQCVWTKAAGC